MDIRAADAATFILDVDIIIFEDLGGKLGGCQLECSGAIGKSFAIARPKTIETLRASL